MRWPLWSVVICLSQYSSCISISSGYYPQDILRTIKIRMDWFAKKGRSNNKIKRKKILSKLIFHKVVYLLCQYVLKMYITTSFSSIQSWYGIFACEFSFIYADPHSLKQRHIQSSAASFNVNHKKILSIKHFLLLLLCIIYMWIWSLYNPQFDDLMFSSSYFITIYCYLMFDSNAKCMK